MSQYISILLLAYSVTLFHGPAKIHPVSLSNETDVRKLLTPGSHFIEERQQLIQLGEKAFPVYEEILSDTKAHPQEVERIFNVLREVKGDRRRFVEHAIRGLANADGGVRWAAVRLLGQIGTEKEASPVVALLSDGNKVVVNAAAKTLAAIGGPREVVAMDAWLLGTSHRDDAHLRHHVQQCRDELKQRLDKLRAQ